MCDSIWETFSLTSLAYLILSGDTTNNKLRKINATFDFYFLTDTLSDENTEKNHNFFVTFGRYDEKLTFWIPWADLRLLVKLYYILYK